MSLLKSTVVYFVNRFEEGDNMLNWEETKKNLSHHDLMRKNSATIPWEGLLLGNADMGATIFGPAHKLTFRLGKMDLWDARWNEENYKHPLPLSLFKAFIFQKSKELEYGQAVPMNLNYCWQGKETLYPCMRMAGDLLVRVCDDTMTYPLPMTQRLRLEDGLYEAEFNKGFWLNRSRAKCSAFISWQHNILAVRLQLPKEYRRNVIISLGRDPCGGRSWELLSSGPWEVKTAGYLAKCLPSWSSARDPRAGMLPPAELTIKGNTTCLWQVIPGDKRCPERGFSIVAACAEGAEFFMEPSGQAALEAFDAPQMTIFVALASEMEAPDSRGRALTLAQEAVQEGWDAMYAKHAESWKTYWMKSAVQLEDEALERTWVRSSYSLAITARSKRPAPGLFGVCTVNDCPPWRGDRHNDFPEYSGLFWGAFSANHEEQALNYTEFVYNYLPTARRIAREVFECKNGAAFPVTYIDGSELYWFHFTWGRILFLTALHAQNCWWHYQYFGDKEFLKTMAYPVMRECANFYVEMLKKNPPGDYTFWPTIATEIRGWTKDFQFNKNCIEDLAHIKFLMRAVLEASEILNVDMKERKIWKDILDNLPPYPTIVINGKEEFVDFAGQEKRPNYNHSVPVCVFWPAEDPEIYSDPNLREIGINTLSAWPWNHTRLMIAYMRLGMKEKVYEKMLGENVENGQDINAGWPSNAAMGWPNTRGTFLINEMLLSSWDGVIRIFPVWPLEKKAQFRDLRAKGAFLVSAACEAGRITQVSVISERGNSIRMEALWADTKVHSESTGKEVEVTRDGTIIHWHTSAGERFRVSAVKKW